MVGTDGLTAGLASLGLILGRGIHNGGGRPPAREVLALCDEAEGVGGRRCSPSLPVHPGGLLAAVSHIGAQRSLWHGKGHTEMRQQLRRSANGAERAYCNGL